MLKGNLTSFSLGEVFQSLSVNNHTGTLKITQKDGAQKCIYFSHGEISLFSSGSPEPLRIGEILIRLGKISPADLEAALQEQKASKELLGRVLQRRNLITKEDVQQALEAKIREEIYDLFLLTDAEFEFYINDLPEDLFDPVLKNTRIAINSNSVILEGIRRVDEWKLIQRRIRTFEEIFVPVEGIDAGIHPPPIQDLLVHLDGETPVRELFHAFWGSRFECSKTLYELLESGVIRPIEVEDAIQRGAKALGRKDPAKALGFYRFADQLDPTLPQVLDPLARCLRALERPKEAEEVQRRLLRTASRRGMHREALEAGRALIAPGTSPDLESAELVFLAAQTLGDKAAIAMAGDLTARLSLEGKDLAKAEGVLEQLWEQGFKDLNFRLELAEIFSQEGDKDGAVRHLEAVTGELQSPDRINDLIKVLRLIFEIDPRRQDIKLRLQNLLVQQERIEKLKKRKVTIAGAVVILLLLVGTIPLFYELKAREMYCHAQRLEEISLVSNDFTKVKNAYEQILSSYCFSSRANASRIALDRIGSFERVRSAALDREKTSVEQEQARKMQRLREALPVLLKEAKEHDAAGRVQEAFGIYTRIASEYNELPGTRNLQFPLRVTSDPPGATVDLNGTVVGKTPLTVRATKGQELTFSLTRSGCQGAQEKVLGGGSWRQHFSLARRPLGDLKVSGPIQQPLAGLEGRIYFPARDGFLYAISPSKREAVWQRRLGQFGDLVSDMAVAGDDLLIGNVGGELAAVSRESGKSRWRTRFGAPILARPAVSQDRVWTAAVSLDGEVAIIDLGSGQPKGGFRAEDEITGAPVFISGILLVGSADRRLYELEVPTAAPRKALDFQGPISLDIVPAEKGVAALITDGEHPALHLYSVEEGRVRWSCALDAAASGPPVASAQLIFVGLVDGRLIAIDTVRGEPSWKLEASKGRLGRISLAGSHLLLGTESGEVLSVAAATGTKEWGFRADTPIEAPPLVLGDRLYVATSSGKILVLEHIE